MLLSTPISPIDPREGGGVRWGAVQQDGLWITPTGGSAWAGEPVLRPVNLSRLLHPGVARTPLPVFSYIQQRTLMPATAPPEASFPLVNVEVDEARILHEILRNLVEDIQTLNGGSERLSPFWIVPSTTVHRLTELLDTYDDLRFWDTALEDQALEDDPPGKRPQRTFQLGQLYRDTFTASFDPRPYELVGIQHRAGTGVPGICLRRPGRNLREPETRFWTTAANLLWRYELASGPAEVVA